MTTLVTGGAGFIGSALVRHLAGERGLPVVTVDALTYAGSLEALAAVAEHPRHRLERVDIADAPALRHVFETHRPTAVVHLAAESHVDRSIDAPADFVRTNLVGTFTVLQEARRHWESLDGAARERFRVIHVSTDEVFGSLGEAGRFTELSPYAPTSPYAATKAGADHLARAWHLTYGLPVIVTNCTNNYGPFQFPEKLIPLTITRALTGRPLPVYGRGEQVRDWVHVDDHVAALDLVLERGRPGETYAIGAGEERRNIDLVRAIARVVDELAPDPRLVPRERLIQLVADRPGHDARYAIDASKARRELGWAPRRTLDEGLRETVAWYIANPWWSDHARARGYAGERLGLLAEARP